MQAAVLRALELCNVLNCGLLLCGGGAKVASPRRALNHIRRLLANRGAT
jgi:hypothetical protein